MSEESEFLNYPPEYYKSLLEEVDAGQPLEAEMRLSGFRSAKPKRTIADTEASPPKTVRAADTEGPASIVKLEFMDYTDGFMQQWRLADKETRHSMLEKVLNARVNTTNSHEQYGFFIYKAFINLHSYDYKAFKEDLDAYYHAKTWSNDTTEFAQPMSSIELMIYLGTKSNYQELFKEYMQSFVNSYIQDYDDDTTNVARNNDRITRTIQVLSKFTSTQQMSKEFSKTFLKEFFKVCKQKNIRSSFKNLYPVDSEFSNNLLSTIESLHARLSALEAKCRPL